MGVQGAGIKAGVLLGGEGVDLAAQGVKGPGQVTCRAGFRPLEEHVLDEMGDPGELLRLVAAAVFHPDADGAGAHLVQPLVEHPDAVGQNDFFDHKGTVPFHGM